jgi:type I restriction enzyme R subunit
MIFFSQKILRKCPGNWTFVVVTDRQELDEQIYKNFVNAGAVIEQDVQATSGEHLRRLLRENHRNIFTLVHKFHTEKGEKYPKLSDRSDIIVMVDEAHRTQYDILAMNMRNALPNAAFIAFTGTPLMAGEERTREVFGDYVSVYNFAQSVEDNATVPLYYENRIPRLQLTNEALNDDLSELLDNAALDEEQEKKLEREFARQYHLITRDDRLEAIAEDIVAHFMGRGDMGKAMVVSVDKATAVRMYDKVSKYWRQYLDELRAEYRRSSGQKRETLAERVKFMEETDMAVVVSSAQNEVEDFAAKGLDILLHRKRMINEQLDTKFKDPDDLLRIVFVCAMWITGFDVPCLSTIYLDKPMKNHTLMQTIARANRVFEDKTNGLIVDYIGIFRDLQKALAIYGTAQGGAAGEGDTPIKDKEELVKALEAAAEDAEEYCRRFGVEPEVILASQGSECTALIADAADALLETEESKKEYMSLAGEAIKLYKAILPDPRASEFQARVTVLALLVARIRALTPQADISQVMEGVNALLDDSIATDGYRISDPVSVVDLSQIDFEALRRKFDEGRKRTITEQLKGAINSKLQKMVRLNKSRMDFADKFQRLIDDYNVACLAGNPDIDDFFSKLVEFTKELDEEERRGIAEQLSEEELAMFDILTKPDMKLDEKEKNQVKQVARELLESLKTSKLVLDWRKRQQSRAQVRQAIDIKLDQGLPRCYTKEIYKQKCDDVFRHVYDSYYGAGQSIYGQAG